MRLSKTNLSVVLATELLNIGGDSSEPEFDPQLVTHGFNALEAQTLEPRRRA